jgi:uncharacterized DUF497 family protein
MQAIVGVDWDDGNREHCQKHGVTLAEAEEVFRGALYRFPDPEHSKAEVRLRAIGLTAAGRYVFAVYTVRERDGATWLRPISVRFMHRREVELYEKAAAASLRQ